MLLRLLLDTSIDAKLDRLLQATGSEPVKLLSEIFTPVSLVSVDQAAGSDPCTHTGVYISESSSVA